MPAKKAPAKKAPAKPAPPPLPTVQTTATIHPVLMVPTAKAHVSVWNTRQPKLEDCQELITSIAANGQSTAAIARPHPAKKGEYELAAGARRLTACAALGIPLKVEVRPLTDGELQDLILLENLQRTDPDPFAEAALIERRQAEGVPLTEIAARYGKDSRWLQRRLLLCNLPQDLRKRLTHGDLNNYTLTMAEFLGSLSASTLKALCKDAWNLRRCGSLKELQRTAANYGCELTPSVRKAFKDPATLVAGCGPDCATDTSKSLFSEFAEKGDCARCTNPECFAKRLNLARDYAITALLAEATESGGYDKLIFVGGRGNELTYANKKHPIHDSWSLRGTLDDKRGKSRTLVIDLDDPAAPTARWLKGQPSGSSHATPAEKARAALQKQAKANGQKLTEEEVTAAVRRLNCQRKRWKHVHEALCTAIDKLPHPDLSNDRWLALFVTFGSDKRKNTRYDNPKTMWDTYHRLDPNKEPTGGLAAAFGEHKPLDPARLWKDHFHDLFLSRLAFSNGMENFDDGAEMRQEMDAIARLIGFDLTAAKKAADLAIPPPKSLGKVDIHTLV